MVLCCQPGLTRLKPSFNVGGVVNTEAGGITERSASSAKLDVIQLTLLNALTTTAEPGQDHDEEDEVLQEN